MTIEIGPALASVLHSVDMTMWSALFMYFIVKVGRMFAK